MNDLTNIKHNLQKCLLIESQYLGNIQYYAHLLTYSEVLLERYEHYEKGTYRNRAYIATPNGKLLLSIPLKRGKHQRKAMKDVQISYDFTWQKEHWKSLTAAYRSSPYFEFYEDLLEPIYHKKITYLIDLNEELNAIILSQLEQPIKYSYTNKYEKEYDDKMYVDKRSAIHPRLDKQQAHPLFTTPVYHQVFESKMPFIPNLSILDLLFAEGPNTANILKKTFEPSVTFHQK